MAFEAAIKEVAAVMMDAMEGMRATAMAIEVAPVNLTTFYPPEQD